MTDAPTEAESEEAPSKGSTARIVVDSVGVAGSIALIAVSELATPVREATRGELLTPSAPTTALLSLLAAFFAVRIGLDIRDRLRERTTFGHLSPDAPAPASWRHRAAELVLVVAWVATSWACMFAVRNVSVAGAVLVFTLGWMLALGMRRWHWLLGGATVAVGFTVALMQATGAPFERWVL